MPLKKHFIQLEIFLTITLSAFLGIVLISLISSLLYVLFFEFYVGYITYLSINLGAKTNLALHVIFYLLLLIVPIQGFRYYRTSKSLIFLHLLLALLTGLNFALFMSIYPGFFGQ